MGAAHRRLFSQGTFTGRHAAHLAMHLLVGIRQISSSPGCNMLIEKSRTLELCASPREKCGGFFFLVANEVFLFFF